MNKYLSFVLILILALASCSAPPPPQAPPTGLLLTFTPAPSETPGPTVTLPPSETSTPTEILPQDMPQEYKDKLTEWKYTVEDNTVSVDGKAWFQKNEAGEWEKTLTLVDGLGWYRADLISDWGIDINPDKAKELHDKLAGFYNNINIFAGTSNSILVCRKEPTRVLC